MLLAAALDYKIISFIWLVMRSELNKVNLKLQYLLNYCHTF